jgi:hypothetical protein
VHLRLAVAEGDIAYQRGNFYLLADRDVLVVLFRRVEPGDRGIAEGVNGREMGCVDLVLPGECGNDFDNFVPGFKYESVSVARFSGIHQQL